MDTPSSTFFAAVRGYPQIKVLSYKAFCRARRQPGGKKLVSLQFVLMTTDHLDDVLAGLRFLKNLPLIDSHRIAMAGHSFGGQLSLLAAGTDNSVRAVVTFGAAAASWKNSSEI